MNTKSRRQDIEALWSKLDQAAANAKHSHQALFEFTKAFREWNAESQQIAREMFGEWLYSDNNRKRFDALSLIEDLGATEAEEALLSLKKKLEGASTPEAKFEQRRVDEVLAKLKRQ